MMMSRTRIILFLLTCVVLLGACRKSTSNQNSNTAGTPLQETVGGGTAPAGEKLIFRGRIAYELKIEMTLVKDSNGLTGTYFYPRVGKNINLKGSVDKDGNVDLRESDESGKETGVFKGKWKAANEMGLAEIEGKWSRPDGSKETEFWVGQQPIEFAAAVRVTPKVIREASKELRYSLDAEYPQIDGDGRFDKFNRESRGMITKDVAAFKSAEGEASDEDGELPSETQTSTLDISYQVRFATDDLISIEFHEGQYSRGAAHGSSFTRVLNYDVKNGRKLALADLFNPKSNYLNVISAYCIKDLKEQQKKQGEGSMLQDDMIHEGASARADNYEAWTITRKGLWITFDPYQVAAYAGGPQHVLVPYSALKGIIKPDGAVGGLGG
jgi:hypothetical protein